MNTADNQAIVIDFGNTLKKVAVFQNGIMLSLKVFKSLGFESISRYLTNLPTGSHCIISSVIDFPPQFGDLLRNHFRTVFLSHQTPLPLINLYATPLTLGKDRIAAAVAAWSHFPDSDLLVIDAGTAITIDFVSQKGEYHGGAISPGLDMRFRALHQFTGHLPLIRRKNIHFTTGTTTSESVLSGVINGTVAEINGIINQYKHRYPGLKVVFGGGDTKFLHKRLKNSIFALPNLTLSGLYIILKHEIENTSSV